jgi:hypothetical protein
MVRCQPGGPPETMTVFSGVLRRFAMLGDAGAFASRSGAMTCAMRVVEEHAESNSVEMLVDVANCDFRYPRPLRNIVFGIGEILHNPVAEFHVEPASLSVASVRIQAEVDANEVIGKTFYPVMQGGLNISIEKLPPANYQSGRRVYVQSYDSLSPATVNDLVQLVDLWGSLMVTAYPNTEEELRNGESFILNVESGQHDEFTFECLIDRFIASESAFTSLLNLLIIRTRQDVRVDTVVVE